MEVSSKILRRSIHCFLQKYHYFTSTAAFLAFPFSISILVSQALVPSSSSSLLPQINNRLRTLFDAAGFPSTLQFFTILNLKVCQTITSSFFTLPFTITFLLIAKASIIQTLSYYHKQTTITFHYKKLLHTYIYNSFFILSANATSFCLLSLAFGFTEGIGYSSANFQLFLSAAGAVLFSLILANALVISNMALTLSGMEGLGGYMAILKACVLLRGGRTPMALLLALPFNVGLAATEALFQFRIMRTYRVGEKSWPSMALEGVFIAYLYSIFIILDTIVSCMFYKCCNIGSLVDQHEEHLLRIEVEEEDQCSYLYSKNFEELP